jgi:GAF domain-containing protein
MEDVARPRVRRGSAVGMTKSEPLVPGRSRVELSQSDEFEKRLGHLHRALLGGRTTVAKLEAVAGLAKALISECDGAGFALEVREKVHSVGTTDEVTLAVDLIQYDTGEGPCLEAIETSHVVRLELLDAGERWEHFAPGAIDAGVRSVLSVPLSARGRTVGALNLYSRSADGFDAESESMAASLAAYAAEIIATSPLYGYSLALVDEVLEELATRELINNAIGVVMVREHCGESDALEELTNEAERRGASLRETAEWALREEQLRSADNQGDRAPEQARDRIEGE